MKQNRKEKEHSVQFLVLRALAVMVAVVAVLLLLRYQGIIVQEQDVPVPAFQETGLDSAVPAPPAAKQ